MRSLCGRMSRKRIKMINKIEPAECRSSRKEARTAFPNKQMENYSADDKGTVREPFRSVLAEVKRKEVTDYD